MQLPLFRPSIGPGETKAIQRVLSSGVLARGSECSSFEQEFANYVGKKYAIATNSGTSALFVVAKSLGWGAGDEVITTPFSYVASANIILMTGATPVFVDIDPETLNIDPPLIRKKISPKTRGMVIVHALGRATDPAPLRAIARQHRLSIIEDACEAIGRPTSGFPVTQLGDATVYGFHQNKQLTTAGEGGMIVTNNRKLAELCRALRDQGRSTKKNWLQHVTLGYNFRLTELQAAYGRAQLLRLDALLKERSKLAVEYTSALSGINSLILPSPAFRSWFFYYVLLSSQVVRTRVQQQLADAGIESSTNYFPPIYRFPAYVQFRAATYPHTESISKRLLVLPLFPGMTKIDIDTVAKVICQALQ
ncbi:DegT/DnrJ/EryC1/StrS aminotransferase family protein [Candidatus Berkelbacteria bacterium]|nr:DegT/DnrJ/EryC1/StrS aminotransferase family protein [Candidatus Berkelbacteria bacterium]